MNKNHHNINTKPGCSSSVEGMWNRLYKLYEIKARPDREDRDELVNNWLSRVTRRLDQIRRDK